jgi:hypothetical protein
MSIYTAYFDHHQSPVFQDEDGKQYPLRDGVISIELPEGNPDGHLALQELGLVHSFGWVRTARPIPPILRGSLLLFDHQGALMLCTPVPVTLLVPQRPPGRLALTYSFTSRPEQIQAAIDSYGEQAMVQLMQELGELECDLPARFNAEGAYRIP